MHEIQLQTYVCGVGVDEVVFNEALDGTCVPHGQARGLGHQLTNMRAIGLAYAYACSHVHQHTPSKVTRSDERRDELE